MAPRPLFAFTPRQAYSYRSDPSVPPFPDDKPLILFDGYCGLCSRMVQFVMRHDTRGRYRFMSAQSETGDAVFRHYGLDRDRYDTFVLLENGRARFVSDAAITLVASLGFPWTLTRLALVITPGVRDRIYLWVAHRRMTFFGASDTCYAPDPVFADRFITPPAETTGQC